MEHRKDHSNGHCEVQACLRSHPPTLPYFCSASRNRPASSWRSATLAVAASACITHQHNHKVIKGALLTLPYFCNASLNRPASSCGSATLAVAASACHTTNKCPSYECSLTLPYFCSASLNRPASSWGSATLAVAASASPTWLRDSAGSCSNKQQRQQNTGCQQQGFISREQAKACSSSALASQMFAHHPLQRARPADPT